MSDQATRTARLDPVLFEGLMFPHRLDDRQEPVTPAGPPKFSYSSSRVREDLPGRSRSNSWSESRPTVHVVDAEESTRNALSELLRSEGLLTATYASAAEFLSSQVQGPGCLVIEVFAPAVCGLEFQSRLERLAALFPIVLTTNHADAPMIVRAMKAGAVDVFEKPFKNQDMLDAVDIAISRDRLRRVAERRAAEIANRFRTLTPRQRQVMALVAAGKMNKQIAYDLDLSEITVKVHRGAAMRKMKARSLAELVRMADELASLSSLFQH